MVWRGVFATTGTSGLREQVAGTVILDVSSPASLAQEMELGDEPVLVVSHPVDAHTTRVACAVLAGHRPDVSVTHVVSTQLPLASILALAVAGDLSRDAGHAVSIFQDLTASIWSAAVLNRVDRLAKPSPTVTQHLRSWFPGGRFVVRVNPEPTSVPAKKLLGIHSRVERGSHEMFVSDGGSDHPVVQAIVSGVAPTAVRTLEVPVGTKRSLGHAEQVQMALLPVNFAQLVRPQGSACPTCGLSAFDPVCHFCRTRTATGPQLHAVSLSKSAPVATSTSPGRTL